MTVVACFNVHLAGAVLVADSRLSYLGDDGRPHTVRDVCQKIFPPTDWSLMGLAGNLCLLNHLGQALFDRLRDTEWSEDTWLEHDDQVRDFVLAVAQGHTHYGSGHDACVAEGAAAIIAWIGSIRFDSAPGVFDHYEPGTKAMSLTTNGQVQRQDFFHPLVIGDGGVIKPLLTPERSLSVANGESVTQQILMALNWTRLLITDQKVASVGGLYQAAHLARTGGNKFVPYFYWAGITRRFGTYVAMRVKDGRWLQEHRPSGYSVPVMRPEEILGSDGHWPIGKHEMFEPRDFLTNMSKGVYRSPNPVLLYTVYDPANVPAGVIASWGPEPLEPQTFTK